MKSSDYPVDENFETSVSRHADNRKRYAIMMKVSRHKLGFNADEVIDVVDLKLPIEVSGSFDVAVGIYPAYHMNRCHGISALLSDVPENVEQFLVNVNFEATKTTRKKTKQPV